MGFIKLKTKTNVHKQMCELSNDVITMIHRLIHREFTQLLIKEYVKLSFDDKLGEWYNWRPLNRFRMYREINSIFNNSGTYNGSLPERYEYSSGKNHPFGFIKLKIDEKRT